MGGTDNLKAIDACITRLRLTVGDSAKVNDAACKRLGASGVVKLNKQTIQVIVGAKAESIGDEMKSGYPRPGSGSGSRTGWQRRHRSARG
nr:EIICB-Glc [Klebsiella pneumoniae]